MSSSNESEIVSNCMSRKPLRSLCLRRKLEKKKDINFNFYFLEKVNKVQEQNDVYL